MLLGRQKVFSQGTTPQPCENTFCLIFLSNFFFGPCYVKPPSEKLWFRVGKRSLQRQENSRGPRGPEAHTPEEGGTRESRSWS